MAATMSNGTGRIVVHKTAITGTVGVQPCHQARMKNPGHFYTGGSVHIGHNPNPKKGGKN